jgi:hypothetical protein
LDWKISRLTRKNKAFEALRNNLNPKTGEQLTPRRNDEKNIRFF